MYDYPSYSDEDIENLARGFTNDLVIGPVAFEIASAKEGYTTNGNRKITLRLNCVNTDLENSGKNGSIFEDLIFHENCMFKFVQLFKSIDEIEMFKSKNWDAHWLVGKKGYGVLGIRKWKDQHTGDEHEKMEVSRFTFENKPSGLAKKDLNAIASGKEEFSDDLPF